MSTKHNPPDVVVVGAGAGGATAALRLAEFGLDVVVLDRGGFVTLPPRQDAQTPSLWMGTPEDGTNVWDRDPARPYIAECTWIGGSTNVFASNMLRFHPEDFHRRSLLGDVAGANLADWPLQYDELAPHYDALEQEMGIAGGDLADNAFEPARVRPLPRPAIPLDAAGEVFASSARRLGWHPYGIPTVIGDGSGRNPCVPCGRCAGHVCSYGARWSARDFLALGQQRGKVRVVPQVAVTRVLVDATGDRAQGVEYADESGALHVLNARAVILAANAVQTPRIMFNSSNERHPQGLCNDSGQVGRNLMTHAHAPIWISAYLPEGPDTTRTPGSTIAIQDFYTNDIGLGITLEPRALGSFAGWQGIVAHDPALPAASDVRARAAYDARYRSNVLVVNIVEDVPVEGNRITLSATRKDKRGLPIPEIHHEAHPLDLEVGALAATKANALLDAAGAVGRFDVHWGAGRFHVFGTARMGDDPSRSVVDAFGRTHRVPNLYIADASLFVTSAGVNPALTICALARRAAEHLVHAFASRAL